MPADAVESFPAQASWFWRLQTARPPWTRRCCGPAGWMCCCMCRRLTRRDACRWRIARMVKSTAQSVSINDLADLQRPTRLVSDISAASCRQSHLVLQPAAIIGIVVTVGRCCASRRAACRWRPMWTCLLSPPPPACSQAPQLWQFQNESPACTYLIRACGQSFV